MIIVSRFNTEFTIEDDFTFNPANEELKMDLDMALSEYDSPAQGFKTSFVAEQLKKYGYEILELEDEEMENSPEDRVY